MNNDRRKSAGPFEIFEAQPTAWFETLYAGTDAEGAGVPWANMQTHPAFDSWLDRNVLDGSGKTALVVGCGMGDDAVALEALGFDVTAFDVSASAIELCKQRFPQSKVAFEQADLLEPQPQWRRKFDFVLEVYTVQALPPVYERVLIESIAEFVSPNGQLVVVAETSVAPRAFESGPPWLLTPDHIDAFASQGLVIEEKHGEPPEFDKAERQLTTTFRRPAT